MKRLANIIAILMVVMAFRTGYAQDETQGVTLTDVQSYALEFVNQIRLDPLAYAESLGYDRDALLQELPWMADVLKNGLPPYLPSDGLILLAEQNNSLTQPSTIEETCQEEGEESVAPPLGSDFALTGEMGGVVSFYNYLSAEFAWEIIIRNRFLQELNPDMTGSLYLLNPGFDTMGMAIAGGTNEVDGEVKNAYFATLCFASSRLKSEAQVLNLINQVRSDPDTIETYMGVSLLKLLNYNLLSLSKWFWIYPPLRDSSNLPPLMGSSALYGSARLEITRLLNPEDPSLPETELIPLAPEVAVSDSLATVSLDITSDQVAATVFTSLLGDELRDVSRQGAIFSVGTNEAGVGIVLASSNDQEQLAGVAVHARLSSVDEPLPVDETQSIDDPLQVDETERVDVYGVVFSDTDGNEIYSAGEGNGQVLVDVFRQSDNTLVHRSYTDGSGHFSARLESGLEYRFEMSVGEPLISFSRVVEESLFLPVRLPQEF